MSWSRSSATTATPERGWIGRVWMRCAMLRGAGLTEAVWCLPPDRLAHMNAYQVMVSWAGTASACCLPTRRRSMTIRKPGC